MVGEMAVSCVEMMSGWIRVVLTKECTLSQQTKLLGLHWVHVGQIILLWLGVCVQDPLLQRQTQWMCKRF